MNSVILQKLRVYCNKKQTNWAQLLSSIMMSYRVSPAVDSTGYSPYYIMFGRECRLPLDTALIPTTTAGTTHEQHLRHIIKNQTVCRELVRENKKYYDKKAKTSNFNVHDNVWRYNPRTEPGLSPKLTQRWTGPFYIAEKNSVKSIIDSEKYKTIKSVVHANRFKPYFNPALRPTNITEALRGQNVVELQTEEDEDRQENISQDNMATDSHSPGSEANMDS
ncbi:uncharacterized protein LOC128551363 [Mercenaria mercenaria]|uniref:uncharacterized protein LOC128551363 n=1 Tax=Mercenaria mercenaria TaxID=6596 RepID=UPI00234F08A7|nr:uncharacterized protein LOC128551363 [Mercenaria mercenaria]